MIIFGSGGDELSVGEMTTGFCPNCQRDRAHSFLLQYRYSHLYWIFAFVTEKKYFFACLTCRQGHEVEASTAERELGHVPIPFMQRFGCLVLLLIVGLFLAIGALSRR